MATFAVSSHDDDYIPMKLSLELYKQKEMGSKNSLGEKKNSTKISRGTKIRCGCVDWFLIKQVNIIDDLDSLLKLVFPASSLIKQAIFESCTLEFVGNVKDATKLLIFEA